MGAYYIATDLEFRAKFDPEILHIAFSKAGLHGRVDEYQGVWTGRYSSSVRCCRIPFEALNELVGIIESLDEEPRLIWNRCLTRRLDMGFESFEERFCSKWQIKPAILRRLADVGASLVTTIYRNDEPWSEQLDDEPAAEPKD